MTTYNDTAIKKPATIEGVIHVALTMATTAHDSAIDATATAFAERGIAR